MSKINVGRVVLGGIVAGIIINLFEFALNGWFYAAQWPQVMASIHRPPLDIHAVINFNIIGFALGIATLWTYAAIRPRFGSGPRTAFIAALLIWVVGYALATAPPLIMGVYPLSMGLTLVFVGLLEIVVAALAGAWFYTEA